MGREIRRVPPNWEHPRWTDKNTAYARNVGEYCPCYDNDYESAAKEWVEEFSLWLEGKHKAQNGEYPTCCRFFWDYDTPPSEEHHRPAFTEEPTWYQLYETVSEGTPVSPPFPTLEGLAQYLADNGDFWYQKDHERGGTSHRTKPTYEQALKMVEDGFALSGAIVNGCFLQPHEQGLVLERMK